MEFHERIKYLRKETLHLSRVEFGTRLGVTDAVINNIERGRLARPEQKEPIFKLICKTFNVSYGWLTTGQGDMFVETKKSFVERFAAEAGLSIYVQKIIESYLGLDAGQREVIDGFFKGISDACTTAPSVDDVDVDEVLDNTIEIFRAAKSEDNSAPERLSVPAERIKRLDEAPEADEI